MSRNLEKEKFVCIDCETTGLDPQKDHVIELAVCTFTFEKIIEEYETLIDPQCPIPQSSTDIHHISCEMVQGKPLVQDVLPHVLKMIGRHTIIGHGVQFDIDILVAAAKRNNIPCTISNNLVIDTLRLARLYGDSPSNALETLGIHFNVNSEGHHRAMNDVRVNIEVFKRLANKFKNCEALFKALSKPIQLKVMPLGKHKGRPFRDIPIQYLHWASTKDFDQDLLFSIRSEIKKRKQGNLFEQSNNPFAGLEL